MGFLLSYICATCVLYQVFLCESAKAELPTCQPDDFHWEYTECDSQGGRWRVEVPHPAKCEGGAPKPPVRGVKCDQMCAKGEYLDVQGKQDCQPCPAGTYSLGGGVRFEDWEQIPDEFETLRNNYASLFSEGGERNISECSSNGWIANGKEVMVLPSECSASLLYTTSLVTAGSVKFVYQFEQPESMLLFKIENSETSQYDDYAHTNEFPEQTKDGEWLTKEFDLSKGVNTLEWKVLAFNRYSSGQSQFAKPVKIKSIEITGIAFTQECTKCMAGTSSEKGASDCDPCPKNTYSQKGASSCTQCNTDTEYSLSGSGKCLERPPCTDRDYFQFQTACKDNKTQTEYHWISNKVCLEHLSQSVKRPESTVPQDCPPCNPGMEMGSDGLCTFCKDGLHSDGSNGCQQCPGSTAPQYAYQVDFWNAMPLNANISSSCLANDESCCSTDNGWMPSTDSIQTMITHCDSAYLVYSIDIGGFRGQQQFIGDTASDVAEISFVFETSCSEECIFHFIEQGVGQEMTVVESWSGSQSKTSYKLNIKSTVERQFSWAFSKNQKWGLSPEYNLADDWAKVYNVKVTNTKYSGAVGCQQCPKGANTMGCVPCPKNNYIDVNTTQCKQCPAGTIIHSSSPWGKDACMACGEGLKAAHQNEGGDKCVTSCKYRSKSGQQYDFTALSHPVEVIGSKQFSSGGSMYYHVFNISLCAGSYNFESAMCFNNISAQIKDEPPMVRAAVCRSTIIPPKSSDLKQALSAQPVSVGDSLIRITTDGSSLNMTQKMKEAGFELPDPTLDVEDVHFVYMSSATTSACSDGRSTIISLRCDMYKEGSGIIQRPPNCLDGTCDGCNLHFLWLSSEACPACNLDSYTEITGECVDGEQQIHYIAPKYCPQKEPAFGKKCSILPFWLEVTIISMCALALLLCVMVVYCWNRNKKLEYKYMKLVTPSDGREVELPAAETCALDEDDDEDEDEHFDAVQFKESKSNSFFSKIKSMGNKKEHIQDVSPENSSLLG